MKQFIKFGIVGLSNTAIYYFLYLIILFLLESYGCSAETDYMISSVLAFLISVFWAFYWNDRFTFRQNAGKKRSKWRTLIKTCASYSVTGLLLNHVLLYCFVYLLGISKHAAPVINLVVTVPVNFILNKYWAFK